VSVSRLKRDEPPPFNLRTFEDAFRYPSPIVGRIARDRVFGAPEQCKKIAAAATGGILSPPESKMEITVQ
jgi:hypothetical protein